MKNTIIILILCLFISSCSKDDESSKLFFDKYNGISWELLDTTNEPTGSGITFHKAPKGFSNFDFDTSLQEVVCTEITAFAFGVENETGDIYNIVEENENNIVGEWINEGNDVELIFSFTVTTNGDLELYFYNDNGDAEIESIYTRLVTSPCN